MSVLSWIPDDGDTDIILRINLELSSEDFPVEAHSLEILHEKIVDAMRKIAAGICYHYGVSYTKRPRR